MREKEPIERDPELFLADLNETMEDFGHAYQEM